MAGVKGRSGGARPGAGRKPKPKPERPERLATPASQGEAPSEGAGPLQEMDMLAMLQAVALGKVNATSLQVRAAIAAVQYTHTKRGDGGKKDAAGEAARKVAAAGKFSAAPPPKLAAVGGRKI